MKLTFRQFAEFPDCQFMTKSERKDMAPDVNILLTEAAAGSSLKVNLS